MLICILLKNVHTHSRLYYIHTYVVVRILYIYINQVFEICQLFAVFPLFVNATRLYMYVRIYVRTYLATVTIEITQRSI